MAETKNDEPTDEQLQREGEAHAAKFGAAIVAKMDAQDALRRLLLTYEDVKAEEILWELRGQFWAIDLPDAVKAAKRSKR